MVAAPVEVIRYYRNAHRTCGCALYKNNFMQMFMASIIKSQSVIQTTYCKCMAQIDFFVTQKYGAFSSEGVCIYLTIVKIVPLEKGCLDLTLGIFYNSVHHRCGFKWGSIGIFCSYRARVYYVRLCVNHLVL